MVFPTLKVLLLPLFLFNSMQLSCKCYGTSSGEFSVDVMVAFQNGFIEDDSFSKVNIILQVINLAWIKDQSFETSF